MAQAFDATAQQAQLTERATEALALAKQLGADAAEVGASVDQGLGVSVRLGEVETVCLQIEYYRPHLSNRRFCR